MTHRLRRVLALLPGAALGGAEAQTATLLRALAAAGVEVIAAIAPDLAPAYAAALGADVTVRPAPIAWAAATHGPGDGATPAQAPRRGGAPPAHATPTAAASAAQAAAAAPLLAGFRPDLALLPLPWPTHALGLQAACAAAGIPALAIAHLAPTVPASMPPGHWGAHGGAHGGAHWGADWGAQGGAHGAPTRPARAADAHEAASPAPPDLGRTLWGAVSGPVAARLAATFALPPGRVQIVRNGVALPPADRPIACVRAARRTLLGLPAHTPLVLAAGRLEPNKGADLLAPLAAALHARTGATLVALGTGPLAATLAAHPAARGPAPPLRLPGHVADVGAWMDAADALVLPSRLEGCPLVFLEAAVRRLPVVASAAALEAWGDEAAIIARVDAAPAIGSLADALAATLAGGPATASRIAAAHAHAAAHDADAMAEAWLALAAAAVA